MKERFFWLHVPDWEDDAGAEAVCYAQEGQMLVATRLGIENEFLRVTLDPTRCGVRSIVDKSSGRELVNPQSPYAVGV